MGDWPQIFDQTAEGAAVVSLLVDLYHLHHGNRRAFHFFSALTLTLFLLILRHNLPVLLSELHLPLHENKLTESQSPGAGTGLQSLPSAPAKPSESSPAPSIRVGEPTPSEKIDNGTPDVALSPAPPGSVVNSGDHQAGTSEVKPHAVKPDAAHDSPQELSAGQSEIPAPPDARSLPVVQWTPAALLPPPPVVWVAPRIVVALPTAPIPPIAQRRFKIVPGYHPYPKEQVARDFAGSTAPRDLSRTPTVVRPYSPSDMNRFHPRDPHLATPATATKLPSNPVTGTYPVRTFAPSNRRPVNPRVSSAPPANRYGSSFYPTYANRPQVNVNRSYGGYPTPTVAPRQPYSVYYSHRVQPATQPAMRMPPFAGGYPGYAPRMSGGFHVMPGRR